MSAGLSTTITITFTPQLNEDIHSVFPILSETGRIDIPLICTCKKALIEVETPKIDFGNVIFGEQNTQYLKIVNKGALPTKIFVKAPDGTTIPFVSVDDIKQKEKRRLKDREASRAVSPLQPEAAEGEEGAEGEASAAAPEGGATAEESKMEGAAAASDNGSNVGKMRTIASRSSLASRNKTGMELTGHSFAQGDEYQLTEADIFDEFLA